MDSTPEPARPNGVTAGVTDTEDNAEQPATGYMHGWALASLTVAFMSICFVLAIDNTILGSCPTLRWREHQALTVIPSDGDTPDHQRLPKPQRHRLVWLFLLDCADGPAADLWPLVRVL